MMLELKLFLAGEGRWNGRSDCYASHVLSKSEHQYCVTCKELLAVFVFKAVQT